MSTIDFAALWKAVAKRLAREIREVDAVDAALRQAVMTIARQRDEAIRRADELETIVNDGGNQAAKYWRRLTAAERALEAERANVKRAQAEALRDAARDARQFLSTYEAAAWLDNRADRIENEGERA